ARAHRAPRRIFPRQEALSQRRLLFGHHAQGDGLPDHDVHGAVRARPHGRLDRAVEGDDRGPAPEDRAPPPALYRRDAARLSADLAAEPSLIFALSVPHSPTSPWRGEVGEASPDASRVGVNLNHPTPRAARPPPPLTRH